MSAARVSEERDMADRNALAEITEERSCEECGELVT
jgi:hypothetical protein